MRDVQVLCEIDPAAQIASDTVIGPYCVVGPHVTIGPGSELVCRVSVRGHVIIGSGNRFGEGCAIGEEPQDLKYAGAPTLVIIGHGNRFGRAVTVHIGTEAGGHLTRIGDDNVLDDGSHVAHDCFLDDRTYLGRNVLLAGHIRIRTGAVVEDMVGVHHFVTIGQHARVGARTPVRRDVPPYTCFASEDYDWSSPPAVRGIHDEGIRAAGLAAEEEKDLRRTLSELFEDETALQTKIEQLVSIGVEGEAARLCQFVQRSLQGLYGRHRETYRGRIPPESRRHLPPEQLARIRRPVP